MSNNNKQRGKKPAPKQQNLPPGPPQQQPQQPQAQAQAHAHAHAHTPKPVAQEEPEAPRVPRGPPPPGRVKQFGKYMTSKNPVSFHIEGTAKTGKFEVVAVDEFGQRHEVASSPNYVLACTMLQTCQDTCNDELDVTPTSTWFDFDKLVSNLWDQFFSLCASEHVDRINLELLQSEAQRAKDLIASLRTEPLIRFGMYACARKDIKCFEIVEKGGGASYFLLAYDRNGGAHICECGSSGEQDKLSRKLDEYVALANQQHIDAALRTQWSLPPPPPKNKDGDTKAGDDKAAMKSDELMKAEFAANTPKKDPKKKWKKVKKLRPKKVEVDPDADVDDKKEPEMEEYSDFEEDGFVGDAPKANGTADADAAPKSPAKFDLTPNVEAEGKPTLDKFSQKKHSNLAASRLLTEGETGDDDDDDDDGEDDGEFVNLVDPSTKKAGPAKQGDGKMNLTVERELPIDAKEFAPCNGTVLPNGSVEVVGGTKE